MILVDLSLLLVIYTVRFPVNIRIMFLVIIFFDVSFQQLIFTVIIDWFNAEICDTQLSLCGREIITRKKHNQRCAINVVTSTSVLDSTLSVDILFTYFACTTWVDGDSLARKKSIISFKAANSDFSNLID